jgi:hypothetical protein
MKIMMRQVLQDGRSLYEWKTIDSSFTLVVRLFCHSNTSGTKLPADELPCGHIAPHHNRARAVSENNTLPRFPKGGFYVRSNGCCSEGSHHGAYADDRR